MNKNLTVRMGNCNHRKYIPDLIDLVGPAFDAGRSGAGHLGCRLGLRHGAA